MKAKLLLVLVGLLLLAASVFAAGVSVPYGGSKSLSLDLNKDTTELLTVTVTGIPDTNVSYITVYPSYDIKDRVFCAPSPKTVTATDEEFTCVIVPGDSFSGDVVFSAFDENDTHLKDSTLHLDVTYKEVWYEAKAVAKVGSTINLGPHSLVVKKASFIYALLNVDGNPVTAFVNDETKVSDNLFVVYKGYDPDTREVFLAFKATYPISVSVQTREYYLVAPRVVYPEANTWTIDIYTDCSSVEYRLKGSDTWDSVAVSDSHAQLTVDQNVGRVYLRCSDDQNLVRPVYLKPIPVKVVKETLDENQVRGKCVALGYITKDQCPHQDCAAWASTHGYVRPPAGYECKFVKPGEGGNTLLIGIAILVVLAVLYYLYRQGKIRLPKKSEELDVVETRPIEPAQDVE